MSEVLDALALVIAKRRAADVNGHPLDEGFHVLHTAYPTVQRWINVASLNANGLNKILEKVGEEAIEVVLAAKDAELAAASNDRVINEVADLVFHTLVMLDRLGISHNEVLDALASRQGLSGLQEKASRNQ